MSTSMGYLPQWGIYLNGVSTKMGYLPKWGIYLNGGQRGGQRA